MSCGADGTFRRADFNTCVFDEVKSPGQTKMRVPTLSLSFDL
jgi:hypothetical protein